MKKLIVFLFTIIAVVGCTPVIEDPEIGMKGVAYDQTTGTHLNGVYEGSADTIPTPYSSYGYFELKEPAYLTVMSGDLTVMSGDIDVMSGDIDVMQTVEIKWRGILIWEGSPNMVLFLKEGKYEMILTTWINCRVGEYKFSITNQRGITYKYR